MPRTREAPARGDWLTTRPRALVERAYRMRPTLQFDRTISLRAVASVLPTTLGTRHRGGVGGGPTPTVKEPRSVEACGSETYR